MPDMEDHITPHLRLLPTHIIHHNLTLTHILDNHMEARPHMVDTHMEVRLTLMVDHTVDHMVGLTETALTQQTPLAPTLIQVHRD